MWRVVVELRWPDSLAGKDGEGRWDGAAGKGGRRE